MAGEILGILGKVTVAERIFPDPEQAAGPPRGRPQADFRDRESRSRGDQGSQNWLQRSWRPITMLSFVALIVARWLGWSAPNLPEDETLKIWYIVETGRGHLTGRSARDDDAGVAGSPRYTSAVPGRAI